MSACPSVSLMPLDPGPVPVGAAQQRAAEAAVGGVGAARVGLAVGAGAGHRGCSHRQRSSGEATVIPRRHEAIQPSGRCPNGHSPGRRISDGMLTGRIWYSCVIPRCPTLSTGSRQLGGALWHNTSFRQ